MSFGLGGFNDQLGLEFESAGPSEVVATIVVRPHHCDGQGRIHLGVVAAVAEGVASPGATLAVGRERPGLAAVGLENHTSMIRAVGLPAKVTSRATPLDPDTEAPVWQVEHVRESDGCRVAWSVVRLMRVNAGDGDPLPIGPSATLYKDVLSTKRTARLGERGRARWLRPTLHAAPPAPYSGRKECGVLHSLRPGPPQWSGQARNASNLGVNAPEEACVPSLTARPAALRTPSRTPPRMSCQTRGSCSVRCSHRPGSLCLKSISNHDTG